MGRLRICASPLLELQLEGVAGAPRGRGAGPMEENINIWAGPWVCVFCRVEVELGGRAFSYPPSSCSGTKGTGWEIARQL